MQWIILFSIKDNIAGYDIKQVLLLWGLASGTYGISHFFFKKAYSLYDTINNGKFITETVISMITHFATYPDGIFKGITKIILYTIIPVGIMNYIPIHILKEFDAKLLLLVIAVTIGLTALAFLIFNKGLKRYSSSNLMSARI